MINWRDVAVKIIRLNWVNTEELLILMMERKLSIIYHYLKDIGYVLCCLISGIFIIASACAWW